MQARAALTVALVAGLLAVTLVTADTVWSLAVRLDARDDGEWVTVTRSYTEYTRYEPAVGPIGKTGCHGTEFKLTLDNDKPLDDSVRLVATWETSYPNVTAADGELEDRIVDLEPFDVVATLITVPAEAFAEKGGERPEAVTVTIQVVGELWFSHCVAQEA